MNGRLLAQQGQPLMQPYLVGIGQRVGEHEAGLPDRHGHDILRSSCYTSKCFSPRRGSVGKADLMGVRRLFAVPGDKP
jgi:hypothetical protein